MASSPKLPLFYDQLQPLSSSAHANYRLRASNRAKHVAKAHAIPITVDEFIACQRDYPIVFSQGENPVPLVLMGLHEGVNVFLDDEGQLLRDSYMPAYVRRYPFILARLRSDSQELSLCFDPSAETVGEYEDGQRLFEDGKPTETTNNVLKFCEEFELAAQRTTAFMKELQETGLLIEGEVAIQITGSQQPFLYRGFQMISEEKFREVRGDDLRRWNQNGMLPLIVSHLFSLSLIRDIFGMQMAQGKGPAAQAAVPQPEPANA